MPAHSGNTPKRKTAVNPGLLPTPDKFQHALTLHQQGKLAQAQASYEEILKIRPRHFDALHLLGMIAYQNGNPRRALELIDRAIDIFPNNALFYANRAIMLRQLKQTEAALASYDQAIKIKSDFAEAFYNRGNLLKELRQYEAALASYDQAIAIKPDFAEAFSNRGIVLRQLKQDDAALASCDQAIALKPDSAEAHNSRGNALVQQKKYDAALASFDRAIALKPGYAEAHNSRGNALAQLKKYDAALESFNRAIALKTDSAAETCFNRGSLLKILKQIEAALASYDQAIALKPDYAEAYWNKSMTLLLSGNFEDGWDLYEWRWRLEGYSTKPLQTSRPKWKIGDQKERLFIWAEQGVGDHVMFGAFFSKCKMLSTKTLVQIDARLIPIFKRSMPEMDFFPSNSSVDEESYDKHIPMGSLCKVFCNELGNFKTIKSNYLIADKARVRKIRTSLCADDVPLCGMSWKSKNAGSGGDRSIDLKDLIGMLGKARVRFVNLQYGEIGEEINEVRENIGVEVLQCSTVDNYNDLDGFASLIEACDLVISIDNSTVHLAGALGKPTWILLPYAPDWRWLLDREDSLWYPSVRLYRQETAGNWNSVLERVKADLIKTFDSI